MMKWFFIEKKKLWTWFFTALVLIIFNFYTLLSIWFGLLVLILFLFRRPRVNYKDTPSNSSDIILAPATGEIIDIIHNVDNPQFDPQSDPQSDPQNSKELCHLIKISIPFRGPYGLSLPFSCQVNGYECQEGKKIARGKKLDSNLSILKKKNILIENKSGKTLLIQVLSSYFSGKSQIWARPGDRGRSAACFGLVPFGGETLLSLPTDGDILVKIGDKVKSGETVLAGLKGASNERP